MDVYFLGETRMEMHPLKKGYEKPIHIEGNYKDDLRWNAYSILQEVKDYKGFDKAP